MGLLLPSHLFGGYAFSGLHMFKIINKYYFSAFSVQPLLERSLFVLHFHEHRLIWNYRHPILVVDIPVVFSYFKMSCRGTYVQHTTEHPPLHTDPLHLRVSCLIPSYGHCMYICAWLWYSKLFIWFINKDNRNVKSCWAFLNWEK